MDRSGIELPTGQPRPLTARRRWTLAWLAAAVPLALAADADATETLFGAGRTSILLRWDAASGPVAYYGVTCAVDGEPEVLVGTSVDPAVEVGDGTHATYSGCRVRAYDAQGNPGPASQPADADVELLPNVDFDGNGSIGVGDHRVLAAEGRTRPVSLELWLTLNRMFGCAVDPERWIYLCPEELAP